MDKENVVYKYSGILFSYKKRMKSFATIWMDLEGSVLSEMTWRKTNTV